MAGPESVIQRAFSGGELAPAQHARADQAKYATGLRTCRNCFPLKAGGVANRAGLRFVAACKTTSASVQLLTYTSETAGESILIEAGNGYLRFFKAGAAVVVTGVAAWSAATPYIQGDLAERLGVTYYAIAPSTNQQPPSGAYWFALPSARYEIPSPFGANGLFNWVQSGRIITMTHPSEPPHELTFESLTRWTITPVVTAPSIATPTNEAGVAGAAGARTYAYQVTAADGTDVSYEQSHPSAPIVIAACAEPTTATPNTLSWDPVTDASEYYVYLDPYENGVFGFIGTAATNAFSDPGFAPDFHDTPPIPRALFLVANDYPAHAAYHQQRRFFAFTNNQPDIIQGSRPGRPSNFTISSPLQDDDALTFRLAGNNNHPVRGLIALKTLLALTDGGIWTIGEPKVPLTPTYLPADQETYAGVHDKKSVVTGATVIYVQSRGEIVRDVHFDQENQGLNGRDLTLWATHLFEGRSIGRLTFCQSPYSLVWATTGGANFLSLTYIPEMETWGWARHDTGAAGEVEDVCAVAESTEDALYCIVKRTIGGSTKRYIERLAPRAIGAGSFDEDVFFVDSGLSYSGAPATVFSGLDHLEGEVVAIVADGAVVFDGNPAHASAVTYTVTGGAITIPTSATEVHIGLPIRYGEIELLDLDAPGTSIRDKAKRTGSVSLLVDRSSRSFWAGPDAAHLHQVKVPPWSEAADETTGIVEMNLTASFNKYGRVFIRQTDPLPLAILGVIPSVELGG